MRGIGLIYGLSVCLMAFAAPLPPRPVADGIRARTNWQPAAAMKLGRRTFVFRDGTQLAREMNLIGASAGDTATAAMAQRLGVPTIDWSKHMVVTVSAGLRGEDADRLTVTRVAVEDDRLTVYYKLSVRGPGPASGFGYPAETVLLDRFSGPVRFEEEKAAPAPKKAD